MAAEQRKRPDRAAKMARRKAEREAELARLAAKEIEFAPLEDICATPTMGGILSTLSMDGLLKRFPKEVLLPVSKRLAARFDADPLASWVVVKYQGRGVAVTPMEAKAHGLTEAPNWIPDLTGVPLTPERSDFEVVGL